MPSGSSGISSPCRQFAWARRTCSLRWPPLSYTLRLFAGSSKGVSALQNLMWAAFGASALIVALALAAVLIRLRGTLGSVQELLDTTNEEMKETLPEVRQTIGNVNDITAGVN